MIISSPKDIYYNYDQALDQALDWVDAYLNLDNNDTYFWYLLKAQILAKMGKEKATIKAAKRTIELTDKNERGDFSYSKKSQEIIDSFN